MNNWNEKTIRFIEQIRSTQEYRDFKQSRDIIAMNPGLRNKVLRFKQKQADLYSTRQTSVEARKKMEELNKYLEELSTIREIAVYLENHKRFNELMLRINTLINTALEEDLKIGR